MRANHACMKREKEYVGDRQIRGPAPVQGRRVAGGRTRRPAKLSRASGAEKTARVLTRASKHEELRLR